MAECQGLHLPIRNRVSPPSISRATPRGIDRQQDSQDGLAGLQDSASKTTSWDEGIRPSGSMVSRLTLLKDLATSQALQIDLQVRRQTGESETVHLHTPMDKTLFGPSPGDTGRPDSPRGRPP